MNILASAMNFGLGPVGKLSSIVNYINSKHNNINWYSCGDRFDLSIFENNIFKDHCENKDEKSVYEYVNKYNIKFAVVILDFELAEYLQKIGVIVYYVDSLPFMWTEADPIPLNVNYYFAQKCVNMNERANRVLSKVKNLIWVNPIIPCIENKISNKKYDVVINLGGMDSPYGSGEDYIKIVLVNILKGLKLYYSMNSIVVTCGKNAQGTIKNILKLTEFENVEVETFKQNQFSSIVKNCKLFLTSPGMTTIYETCSYNKNTIMLPPQNLSQFYNIEFSKQLIKYLKIIDWNRDELTFSALEKYFDLGEDELVKLIYTNISNAGQDKKYIEEFYAKIKNVLSAPFESHEVISFENNGTIEIANKLFQDAKMNIDT